MKARPAGVTMVSPDVPEASWASAEVMGFLISDSRKGKEPGEARIWV